MSDRPSNAIPSRVLAPGDAEWLDAVLGAIEENVGGNATHEARGRAARLRRLWREAAIFDVPPGSRPDAGGKG